MVQKKKRRIFQKKVLHSRNFLERFLENARRLKRNRENMIRMIIEESDLGISKQSEFFQNKLDRFSKLFTICVLKGFSNYLLKRANPNITLKKNVNKKSMFNFLRKLIYRARHRSILYDGMFLQRLKDLLIGSPQIKTIEKEKVETLQNQSQQRQIQQNHSIKLNQNQEIKMNLQIPQQKQLSVVEQILKFDQKFQQNNSLLFNEFQSQPEIIWQFEKLFQEYRKINADEFDFKTLLIQIFQGFPLFQPLAQYQNLHQQQKNVGNKKYISNLINKFLYHTYKDIFVSQQQFRQFAKQASKFQLKNKILLPTKETHYENEIKSLSKGMKKLEKNFQKKLSLFRLCIEKPKYYKKNYQATLAPELFERSTTQRCVLQQLQSQFQYYTVLCNTDYFQDISLVKNKKSNKKFFKNITLNLDFPNQKQKNQKDYVGMNHSQKLRIDQILKQLLNYQDQEYDIICIQQIGTAQIRQIILNALKGGKLKYYFPETFTKQASWKTLVLSRYPAEFGQLHISGYDLSPRFFSSSSQISKPFTFCRIKVQIDNIPKVCTFVSLHLKANRYDKRLGYFLTFPNQRQGEMACIEDFMTKEDICFSMGDVNIGNSNSTEQYRKQNRNLDQSSLVDFLELRYNQCKDKNSQQNGTYMFKRDGFRIQRFDRKHVTVRGFSKQKTRQILASYTQVEQFLSSPNQKKGLTLQDLIKSFKTFPKGYTTIYTTSDHFTLKSVAGFAGGLT